MSQHDIRLCRSILFLPASNLRAIEKAGGLDADMIILDCEDAVKPEDKAAAREAAVEAVSQGFGGRPAAIRMNSRATPFYGEDLVAFRSSDADFLILPKVDDYHQIHDVIQSTAKPILAMIETATGVLNAASIAPQSSGLIAGTNDLAADLRIPPGAGREGLATSLQTIVLAARAAGVAAFDGVHNKLEDEQGLVRQCEQGRAFGFDGKSLIHPSQIDAANRIFGPSPEQIVAAERLIASATGGAERYDGGMIEAMHVEQARAVLAKARR
jgi:citrate lyase subunit beta/citryl-CoA lyase